MLALLLTILTASLAVPANSLDAMAGKWTSTVKPGPGEAPAISPSFTIQIADGNATVSLSGEKEAHQVTVFEAEKGQPFLVFRTPHSRGGTRLIIIRPIGPNQIRFEMFVERLQGKPRNFYYAEVFTQDRQQAPR